MTGGDFSQEAYQALREAYANQLTGQDEQELEGVQVMGQRMTMETLPVDSPWRDKIEKWQYPTGKSAYADGPQKTPEEVLELMREAAAERDLADAAAALDVEDDIDSLSDEDLDAFVDNLLAELDEDEDEEEEEGEDEEDLDEIIDAVLDEEDDEDEEDEEVEEEDEVDEVEEEEDEPEEYDPEEIAAEIQSLRDQLEELQFNPEASTDDE